MEVGAAWEGFLEEGGGLQLSPEVQRLVGGQWEAGLPRQEGSWGLLASEAMPRRSRRSVTHLPGVDYGLQAAGGRKGSSVRKACSSSSCILPVLMLTLGGTCRLSGLLLVAFPVSSLLHTSGLSPPQSPFRSF